MLNLHNKSNGKNSSHIDQMLSIMGITQWHLRDALFVSPDHAICQFHTTLTKSLSVPQKNFLINLYRAIEKLLKLPPSEHLIQKKAKLSVDLNNHTKIQLFFNSKNTLTNIQTQESILIINLPDVSHCAKNPALKSELWKILKNNIH
jgi:DNA polymerase III psi subunit